MKMRHQISLDPFPECVARVPVSLGVWGLRRALDIAQPFGTVRNRSEPFGTVRNRPDPPGYRAVWPCLWRVLQQWSLLEVPASFRVAGMALCDIPTCFITCRKSFCVAGALLLYTFVLFSAFFVAGAALWRPPSFRVAGTALQTCRVACFCESHCQGCVNW